MDPKSMTRLDKILEVVIPWGLFLLLATVMLWGKV
jgi:hypothetical protein